MVLSKEILVDMLRSMAIEIGKLKASEFYVEFKVMGLDADFSAHCGLVNAVIKEAKEKADFAKGGSL